MIVVTRVPYTYAAAAKTSFTGYHLVVVKYVRPNVVSDGHESMRMSRAMATSVSGTSIASAATPAAKMRSKARVTRWSSFGQDGRAARGDGADLLFRFGHDR